MKRSDLIAKVRFLGYHEDTRAATRFFVENRISYAAFNKAFNEGRQSKILGAKCTCWECKNKKGEQ